MPFMESLFNFAWSLRKCFGRLNNIYIVMDIALLWAMGLAIAAGSKKIETVQQSPRCYVQWWGCLLDIERLDSRVSREEKRVL